MVSALSHGIRVDATGKSRELHDAEVSARGQALERLSNTHTHLQLSDTRDMHQRLEDSGKIHAEVYTSLEEAAYLDERINAAAAAASWG